jgi:hypothetical protein
VTIIGATDHYASAELDAGPIIEQDIVRASHGDSVEDLIMKARGIGGVLAPAVRLHLENRMLVYGNKTVVFDQPRFSARSRPPSLSRKDGSWPSPSSDIRPQGRVDSVRHTTRPPGCAQTESLLK